MRLAAFALRKHGYIAVVIMASWGCGAAKPPPAPGTAISGMVKLDEKPAIGAQLQFVPEGQTQGFGASATADEQGRFVAKGGDGSTEVPFGEYRVIVRSFRLPEDPTIAARIPKPNGTPVKIPARYSDPIRTPLKVAISESGGIIDLQLKSN